MPENLNLMCTRCLTTNRFEAPRVGENPKCGECASALVTGAVVDVTANTLGRAVAVDGMPSLADFWAPWSQPCLTLESTFRELASEYSSKCRVFKVNIDENANVSSLYGIHTVPTMILFKNGKDISRRSGVASEANIRTWLNNNL